ncbi:hypothetical protein N4G70_22550 [Streptomyces sp. ASQP_92]|uniref:hypothetical protein n=1 Tax=Streptomyces sp. ASQP_92 TaxID=2979116 RepID=UPI0021BF60C6|nr:hypothetical protein [Streptomyces sp. ASQP_92]MCT9091629.1 hypothetical protein [Streptomyces sp. ASQP_92]
MARIRTIKPEAFISESLAQVSVTAERTFFGLLTQADDHGRFRDQGAVIAGALWSLRPEHGPLGVEDDLNQLHTAGLICRYEGEDGKRYLHIVTWAKHQKINRPSGSRCPTCPRHEGGRPAQPSGSRHGELTAASVNPHGTLAEDARTLPEPSERNGESAGQERFCEASRTTQGGLTEESVNPHRPDLGPRILDLGSPPVGDASAPAPKTLSTKALIAEYAAACANRPPGSFLGHLGKQTAALLAEGIDAAYVRAGLERLRAKGLHPSVLPSLVNEAMNPPAGDGSSTGHRPWTNPVDIQAAYGGDL